MVVVCVGEWGKSMWSRWWLMAGGVERERGRERIKKFEDIGGWYCWCVR